MTTGDLSQLGLGADLLPVLLHSAQAKNPRAHTELPHASFARNSRDLNEDPYVPLGQEATFEADDPVRHSTQSLHLLFGLVFKEHLSVPKV